jgi:hypothetical protein
LPRQTLARAADQGKRLELRDLDRAMALLPEEQRQVILLVGLEGLHYEAVAEIVGVPVGTVRSRLSAAEKRCGSSWIYARIAEPKRRCAPPPSALIEGLRPRLSSTVTSILGLGGGLKRAKSDAEGATG